MQLIQDFFSNRVIIAALLGWLIAQVLKTILVLITTKKLDLERMFGAGGMPSSHSAMATAMTIQVGEECGLGSVSFAIALVFSLIILYDALGVRRQAGEHAKMLNRVAYTLEQENLNNENNLLVKFDELKELLGHTPLEVLGGVVLGILISLVL